MAERLHPEGAPGAMEQISRTLVGDQAYEEQQALRRRAQRVAAMREDARAVRTVVGTVLLTWVALVALVAVPMAMAAAVRLLWAAAG